MNYTLLPSLERLALIRSAITMWNEDCVKSFLVNSNARKEWLKLEDKVIEKVLQLPQPKRLKEKILRLIKPIGMQIFKWVENHNHIRFGINLPSQLCWTSQGVIDEKKTAEAIIKDEKIDIVNRYRTACLYCLEDDIPKLWKKIPERCKHYFYTKNNPGEVQQHGLVVLWTYEIMGEVDKLNSMIQKVWHRRCTPYQYAFEYAAVDRNKVATAYFLQKLTFEERGYSLTRYSGYIAKIYWMRPYISRLIYQTVPRGIYADAFCFLVSQLEEDQQKEVFRDRLCEALYCFLDWPWQEFFMKMAKRMWTVLDKVHFDILLSEIVRKVMYGFKDHDYQKLFGEFWQQSPMDHRKYVIDECTSRSSLLSELIQVKDRENIKLILADASALERERIIFSDTGKCIWESLAFDDKSGLLKFFIQECISRKDAMVLFKLALKNHIKRVRPEELEREKDKWSEFFQSLDEFI